MTAHHFHNQTLDRHGVDVTTDNGDRFGIVCPDELTARQLAAGPEAIARLEKVQADVMKLAALRDPDQLGTWGAIFNQTREFLTNLHASK